MVPPIGAEPPFTSAVDDRAAWERAGWSDPELMLLDPYRDQGPPPGLTHRLSGMTWVQARGSAWTRAAIQSELEGAARVWARCGLEIAPVRLVEADPPGGRTSPDTGAFHELLCRTIWHVEPPRPLLMFLEADPERGLAGEGDASSGAAALAGTGRILAAAMSHHPPRVAPGAQTVTAHELAHILARADHTEPGRPSLLAAAIEDQTDDPDELCGAVVDHPAVRPIEQSTAASLWRVPPAYHCCVGPETATPPNLTAEEAYRTAAVEAVLWKPDHRLKELRTPALAVGDPSQAGAWHLKFWSPSGRAMANIDVENGRMSCFGVGPSPSLSATQTTVDIDAPGIFDIARVHVAAAAAGGQRWLDQGCGTRAALAGKRWYLSYFDTPTDRDLADAFVVAGTGEVVSLEERRRPKR